MQNTQNKEDDPLSLTPKYLPPKTTAKKNLSTENTDHIPSLLNKIKHKLIRFIQLRTNHSLKEEVAELIEEHDPEGTQVGSEERTMLNNVLRLNETIVEKIMVPRADIVAIEDTANLLELQQCIVEKEHTRIPIYKNSLDNVIGFLHIKDLIPFIAAKKKFSLEGLTRKILYIPPSMKILDLLVKMRIKRVHIALVVDEYGGTDGLVTLEDLMEEIVGEIEDEHDEIEKPYLKLLDNDHIEISARLKIKELEEKYNTKMLSEAEEDNFDTVGGLIFSMLGRVPEKNEIIKHHSGIEFIIKEADPRKIKKIIVKRVT